MGHSEENNADKKIENINKAFLKAAEEGNFVQLKQALADGAELHAYDDAKDNALMFTVAYGIKGQINNSATPPIDNNRLEIAKYLIEQGIDINAQDDDSATALMAAVLYNHLEMLELLLAQKGIRVDLADKTGKTALLTAATQAHHHFIKPLLDAKADINAVNTKGSTALILAIQGQENITDEQEDNNFLETINSLIDNKADVNIANVKGNTPLIIALGTEKLGIAFKLLENGANINIANKKGVTAKKLIENLDKQFSDPDFEREKDTDENIKFLDKINQLVDQVSESVKAELIYPETTEIVATVDNTVTANPQVNSDRKEVDTAHLGETADDDQVPALGDGIHEINLSSC